MLCEYQIKIDGKVFKLFSSGNDIDTLDKLKKEIERSINSENSEHYNNILETLSQIENLPELNLDDINENSVGTYTPTELINEFSKNSKEKDLFKSLNLKNRNSLRVIPGFGDVNIPTKYHKGHIFLNLNYLNSRFNNIIALTEMAIADNLGEAWFKENNFSELVNTPGNEKEVEKILNTIISSKKETFDELSNIILTAYYKSTVSPEIGSRNINYERNNLSETWEKHYAPSVDRQTTHTPFQKINIQDLKQGDYVLIPNPSKISNPDAPDWSELFFDYYINDDNNFIIRTLGKNSETGTYFLRNRIAARYKKSGKTLTISNDSSVDASIKVENSFNSYKYNEKADTVTIPTKLGNRTLDFDSLFKLLQEQSAQIITSKKRNIKWNEVESYKLAKLTGKTLTLENGSKKVITDSNSITGIRIEAPVISNNLDNYDLTYKTPSIGENIVIQQDNKNIFGKVIGKNLEGYNTVFYIYNTSEGWKAESTSIKNIYGVELPSSENKNIVSTQEYRDISILINNKFSKIKEDPDISVEKVVKSNLGAKGLNLNGLTYSIQDINEFSSIQMNDLLYRNGLVYRALENVVLNNSSGEPEHFIKTIVNNGKELKYINIPRKLLGGYIHLTNSLNETFARQSIQKNRYEVFSSKENSNKTYIEVDIWQNPNGYIFSYPKDADITKAYAYEKGKTIKVTDKYKETLAKRYKWSEIPKSLYEVKLDGSTARKKDSMNTNYMEFNNDALSEVINAKLLHQIVPGSFVSFKGETDAYIVEKSLGDKLLVAKYVYTNFKNPNSKISPELSNVRAEKFLLTPKSDLTIQGLHIPKWAKGSYESLNKFRIENIKQSKVLDELTNYSDSKELIAQLSEFLQEKFNVKINLITNKDLKSFNRSDIYNARAFTDGKEVYVNIDKASIAEPLHELLHLVMSTMKATDPDTYYSLVNSVQYHESFEKVAKSYEDINTELLEEAFIQLFSKTFRKNILKSGIFNENIFHKAIRNSVKDMFDLEKSLEWEDAYTLMGKPVKTLLEDFGSKLIMNPESLIDESSVYMMFEISSKIKQFLEAGNLEQKCY